MWSLYIVVYEFTVVVNFVGCSVTCGFWLVIAVCDCDRVCCFRVLDLHFLACIWGALLCCIRIVVGALGAI